MHPDSRVAGPKHNLPRDQSSPHDSSTRSPASFAATNREMTVVRIPLKSAKHHFGASCGRGTRPYNEDTHQAGTIELPAFAKKPPMSVMGRKKDADEGVGAESASGDPQVFYFGVFDGHGGDKCSIWLRENLHLYLEESAEMFGMPSTLRGSHHAKTPNQGEGDVSGGAQAQSPTTQNVKAKAEEVQRRLTDSWKDTVGGYFRRFQPDFFTSAAGGRAQVLTESILKQNQLVTPPTSGKATNAQPPEPSPSSLESVLSYSFLRADLDFVTDSSSLKLKAAGTPGSSPQHEQATFEDEEEDEFELGRHTHHSAVPFLGGSTCSIALISTPTPTPFWHPSTAFTILTAHLGDTRILLCSTATGAPVALTPTHHPSSPGEAARLRRYAASFTTDSFGEERISGLANTRAFGDRRSKRVGVSAEPSLTLLHAHPAEFSFMVLISDGVTGVLNDQEIVDTVKEAKTPEEGARKVMTLATEISSGEKGDADNATAVVVRMGGWERRSEGGGGSVGTREDRERRRRDANEVGGRRT